MDRNFDKLVRAAFSEPRDEQVIQALTALIESDPTKRNEFLEYCQLHGDLYFLVGSDSAEKQALDNLSASVFTPHSAHQDTQPKSQPSSSPGSGIPKGLLGLMALAASLVIALVGYFSSPELPIKGGLRQPTIVATVVSAEDATWGERSYHPGQSVRVESRLRIEEGVVKINMPSGAELLLQGPCEILMPTADRVELLEGKLSVRVAEWTESFSVETHSFKIIDLGAHFAVQTDLKGASEAHVLAGKVRVQPTVITDKSRSSFLMHEGQAIRYESDRGTTSRLPARQDQFVTDLGDFRPYRALQIFNTGQNMKVGDEDPHWRIIAGAVGEGFQGPQHAVVCEPDDRYLPNYPQVSQWMSVSKNLRPGCLPNSSYTFQTEFDLTGYDISTVRILADMLADNGVKAVRINGQSVELASWRDNEFGQQFHRFRRAEIVAGFVPGKNTIEIDVWNGIYVWGPDDEKNEPTPNPMSLRVEWQAFGTPTAIGRERTNRVDNTSTTRVI